MKLIKMHKTFNARGHCVQLDMPIVMGIINVNNDSFYSGSRVNHIDQASAAVSKMISQGTSIIDIGAMSSKPGATILDQDTEMATLHPIVNELCNNFPNAIFSIDTVHSATAATMYDLGIHMINDISSGTFDNLMIDTVARLKLPYVLMHMQGLPQFMQDKPQYNQVVNDVISFLADRISVARLAGIKDIIIDPGFGFGKTLDQNFELLKSLQSFSILDMPLLVGISRKSFIYKTLNTTAEDALNGTTALHMSALLNGAKILRVHDVKEAIDCIELYKKLV
jgi:dihydropteroate synthase